MISHFKDEDQLATIVAHGMLQSPYVHISHLLQSQRSPTQVNHVLRCRNRVTYCISIVARHSMERLSETPFLSLFGITLAALGFWDDDDDDNLPERSPAECAKSQLIELEGMKHLS